MMKKKKNIAREWSSKIGEIYVPWARLFVAMYTAGCAAIFLHFPLKYYSVFEMPGYIRSTYFVELWTELNVVFAFKHVSEIKFF